MAKSSDVQNASKGKLSQMCKKTTKGKVPKGTQFWQGIEVREQDEYQSQDLSCLASSTAKKSGKYESLFYASLPEPKCEADDTELIVTMGIDKRADPSQPEIEFKIGGKLLSNGSVRSPP